MQEKIRLALDTHLELITKILFAVLLICLATYIAVVNNISSKGFVIRDLEKSIKEASLAHRDTQFQISELQSPKRIVDLTQKLKMVKVDKLDYISKTASVALSQK